MLIPFAGFFIIQEVSAMNAISIVISHNSFSLIRVALEKQHVMNTLNMNGDPAPGRKREINGIRHAAVQAA